MINNFKKVSEVIFTDSNFEKEVLKSDRPVLVDFFANWCGPCKMQEPIIEAVAKELGEKTKVGKLDVDANPQMAEKYQIMSVPTLIIFKNGKAIETLAGVQNKETLVEKLNKII